MLQRLDNAQWGSVDIAKDKARSAVALRRPTKVFQDLIAQGGANLRLLNHRLQRARGRHPDRRRRQDRRRRRRLRRHLAAGCPDRPGRHRLAEVVGRPRRAGDAGRPAADRVALSCRQRMILQNARTAARALRVNKLRSSLTMLGIIIGVGAVIAMVAVGAGAQARLAEQIQSIGANLIDRHLEQHHDRGGPGRSGQPRHAHRRGRARDPAGDRRRPGGGADPGGTFQAVRGPHNWGTSVLRRHSRVVRGQGVEPRRRPADHDRGLPDGGQGGGGGTDRRRESVR